MAVSCLALVAAAEAPLFQVRTLPGGVAARLEIDRRQVRLDEEVRLTIQVEGPAPLRVEPVEAIVATPEWTCRASPAEIQPGPDGRQRWQQVFHLSPLRPPGKTLLAPLPLQLGSETIAWEPFELAVTTDIDEPSVDQARDITAIERIPPPDRSWQRWLVAAGVAVGVLVPLGLAGWLVARRRGRPAPPPSPSDWARAQLDRLRDWKFDSSDSPRLFLTELSEVARRYLERRFQLPALEETTPDLLAKLASVLTPELHDVLRNVLELCDLAKFARQSYAPPQCHAAAEQLRDFVKATSQPPPTTADGPARLLRDG